MSVADANPIADQIFEFIEYTNESVFLTGKAGTGKTTLLKKIRQQSSKKIAVVAPTGVAAMNAKGTTINSFFQLPPGSFFPGDVALQNLQNGFLSIQSTVNDLSYTNDKLKLFRELELLVIDEVSMVRCDVMDVIDALLRSVRKNNSPFGGLQLLLIGDLFQLPPVAKREDWATLGSIYPSPYFFDALVFRQNPVVQVELTKVYRQTEETFIKILNDIRNNQIDDETLALLNERFEPNYQDDAAINPIVLTSHNAEANAVNQQKLEALPGEIHTFQAEINGEFRDLGLQAEQELVLKVGAQIMFIKNDTGDERKFYNGKIGKVKAISDQEIYISFPNEDDLLLTKSAWQSFEYKLDEDEQVQQQQVGEFLQYPIKLAWAVTIHKSQGLTFDHAIIDAAKSFISGQVYVALSRVRTLSGLVLKSKINKDSLRSNREVINFLQPTKHHDLTLLMKQAQEKYILKLVLAHFNFSDISAFVEMIQQDPEIYKVNNPFLKTQMQEIGIATKKLEGLLEKFRQQMNNLYLQDGFEAQANLQTRIAAANVYFAKELSGKLLQPLLKLIRVKPTNKLQQHIQHKLQQLRQHVENSITLMHIGSGFLEQPLSAAQYTTWISRHRRKPTKTSEKKSKIQETVTLQLF